MAYQKIIYEKNGRISTISFNRPEKYNTIVPGMLEELEKAIYEANRDEEVRVIILQGKGQSFCAGFDFSGGLAHFESWFPQAKEWDPGRDFMFTTGLHGTTQKAMSIWYSSKPVITKIHGWCVGGGSEVGLLGDLVIASDDARIGTPYSRVWGCHLTGMWIYRLGLTKAKRYALTGDSISGKEAAEIGLINFSYPLEELDEKVQFWAEKLAQIPVTQLAAMKFIVNQAYENMGLKTTQYLGVILDGSMRNTPEGKEFVKIAMEEGVGKAVAWRDGPHGDYSQGEAYMKPIIKKNP